MFFPLLLLIIQGYTNKAFYLKLINNKSTCSRKYLQHRLFLISRSNIRDNFPGFRLLRFHREVNLKHYLTGIIYLSPSEVKYHENTITSCPQSFGSNFQVRVYNEHTCQTVLPLYSTRITKPEFFAIALMSTSNPSLMACIPVQV